MKSFYLDPKTEEAHNVRLNISNLQNLYYLISIVSVIVNMCPGDHTSASILAAITRPSESIP